MDSEVVRELIQFDMNAKLVKSELNKILKDNDYRKQMLENYTKLRDVLGGTGASERVAKVMYENLKLS